ncbi:hypothetical protein ACFSJW_22990 [Flavobacterium artemisiae]|uniref:Uncharacterized protein n=1 Tax=Flavobacterium artemisiae TaxID=2126556 RepID=A0ABW4H7A7_9FLAO
MEKQVHIIPKKVEEGQKYDRKLNSLVLKKAESFNIVIKEIEDFKKQKPIAPKKITKLSKEEYSNLSKTARWNYDVDAKQYDIDLKKYNEKLKVYNENLKKFDDLNWTWQLVYNELDPNKITHYANFKKGIHELISFPKLLEGGGIAWLEAWHENEKPKGIPPFGMYVQAEGVAQIVRAEWTDLRYNTIDKGTTVAFGSKVILHIYTAGLYGQEVEVHLADKDIFTPNDKLKIAGEDFFTREVKVYKLKPNDINKKGVAGILTVDNAKVDYAQKIEIEVVLDKAWIKTAGENLQIYAVVKSIKTGTFFAEFSRSSILVSTDKKSITLDQEPIPATNMPLIVGNVETNVSAFHPCRYDLIKASYSKTANSLGNESLEIELFNSKKEEDKIKTKLIMPVIAGVREGRRELKITLDSKTDECYFEDDKEKTHKGRVINLSQIHDAIVIEESTRVNEHKIYDKNEFKIGQDTGKGIRFGKEEEGHVDTDDDNEISNTHTKSKNSINGPFGITRESKTTVFKNKQVRGLYPNSDTELILDIGFDYGDESISSLLKHIWPLREKILQHYPIVLQTCCFTKQLDVTVYPDVKWILQFAYDCDPEEFQDMRKEKYDEYLVRVEKLDDKVKPQKLDEKIQQLDAEIAQAKKDASQAVGKKKESYKKLVAKLEKLNTKNKNRKDRYKDNKKKEKKAYKNDRPDLFSFKENVASGLSDLVLSLHVEYDRPGEAIEVSGSYKRYVELAKQLTEVTQMIDLILDGKKKSQKKLDKKFKQIDEKRAEEQLEAIGDALKGRSLFSKNLIPPSLAVVGSWYAENPKDINMNQVGIVGEIQILAKPLIGAEISMDFLALAQRAHPIARGLITLIDFSAAVGVGPKITLEIEISGQIEIEGKLRYNSASKTSNLNQKSLAGDAEDDSPLTVNGVFSLEIRGKIEFSKKANSYIFGSVELYGNAGFEVKTGITLSGAIKADDKGFFIDPLLTFHGLTVTGIVEAGYKVENSDGGEYSSGSTDESFELVLMNEYEGSFEDSEGKKIQFYLN